MLAIGDGAKQAVLDRISAMGTNLLLVRPGAPNARGVGGTVATLVPDDAEAIAALPNVLAAVPELGGSVTVRFGSADYQTAGDRRRRATFPVARNWPVAQGTFFRATDVSELRAGGGARPDRRGQPVSRRRGSDRPVRAGQQRAVPGDRRDGARGRLAAGAATRTTSSSCRSRTGSLRLFGQRFLRSITVAVDDVDAHRRDAGRDDGAAAGAPPEPRTSRSATWPRSSRPRPRRRTR